MVPLCNWFCNSVTVLMHRLSAPTTPDWQRHQALPPTRFRLIPFRSPLLRESLLFSSPRGTEMFQFPRFPPLVLCVQTRVTPHDGCRVSPFGHLRIDARSTAPRSFSQSPTSFIGSRRQGIHRWLFVAWKSKMLVLAMKFSRCAAHHRPMWPAARKGEQTRRPRPLPGRSVLGCSLKTEQKGPTPKLIPTRRTSPTTSGGRLRHRIISDQLGVPE